MLANITLANYLQNLLTNEKMEYRKEALLKTCEDTQIAMLWNIFFETDIRDKEMLKGRVYEYGSSLKEQDYLGRELFLCLVAVLNLVIK